MPQLDSVVPAQTTNNGSDGPHYDEDYNTLVEENPEDTVSSSETAVEDQEQDTEEVDNEEEQEQEDDEEEDVEDIEPVKGPFSRPSIKDIKGKFPEFFKEFPELKDVIFREANYTQLFPTVEDAKEAFNDNEAFATLSDAALSGDSAPLLESLEKTDSKALNAFACSFLPSLYKRNQEVYSNVVTPLFENLLRQVHKSGDENMKNSAINIATFLFGDDGEDSVLGKKTLSRAFQITEEQKKSKEQLEIKNANAFREAASDISNQVHRAMTALILKDFDPEKVFSKFIREKLAEEIVSKIDKKLNSDNGHKVVMSARWKRARQNGYTSDEKSKIISTYLARAKSLIPSVKEEVRLAALGKTARAAQERGEKVRNSVNPRKELTGGRVPRNGNNSSNSRDYSKMTDREILDL